MSKKVVAFLRGPVYWAKVIGEPRPNYNGDAREWAFEFEPNEEGIGILKENALLDRLKNKYEDRGKYLTLKRSELNKEGEPNKPIRILDSSNNEWDGSLLGNGTVVDVKLDIRDYGPGKKKGIYPVAIRVVDHVEYQSNEFPPMAEDDGFKPAKKAAKAKDTVAEDFGLDDEIVE